MGYTSLAALKSYGGFEGDSEDVLLNALIGSATQIIEDQTKRVFQIDDETIQEFSRLNLQAESRFSGNKLYFYSELAEAASLITDSPTVIYLPEDGPPYYACVITEGSWAHPTVSVTRYWGASKTPSPAVEIVCLRLTKWLYDMKDTAQGTAVVVTPEGQVLLPQGLPSDIMKILAPLMKVVVA